MCLLCSITIFCPLFFAIPIFVCFSLTFVPHPFLYKHTWLSWLLRRRPFPPLSLSLYLSISSTNRPRGRARRVFQIVSVPVTSFFRHSQSSSFCWSLNSLVRGAAFPVASPNLKLWHENFLRKKAQRGAPGGRPSLKITQVPWVLFDSEGKLGGEILPRAGYLGLERR